MLRLSAIVFAICLGAPASAQPVKPSVSPLQFLDGWWEVASAQGAPSSDRYGYPYTMRFISVSGYMAGSGSRGCERLYGKFGGNSERFTFQALEHPQPCIGDANEGHREISVGRALNAASRIEIKSADQIEFVAGDGSSIALSRSKSPDEQRAVLTPELRSLVTGTWVVESINGQPDSRLLPISFTEIGEVGWRDGCNSLGGEYGGTPDTLKITNVIMTTVGCRPLPVSPVLGPEVRKIGADRLEFRNLTGAATVVRKADPQKR